jgi:hypothetical protein
MVQIDTTTVGRAVSRLLGVLSWLVGALWRLVTRLWAPLRAAGRRFRAAVATVVPRARRAFAGPVRRALAGPVRTVLLGRRADVSLLVTLATPVAAFAVAWWVDASVGYEALQRMTEGTWDGTNPSTLVFVAVAVLVALGAVSAAVNSGLVPTTLLVAVPLFGATVTRYGTEVRYSWGTGVVSLPDAVAVAAAVAAVFGVPLAVCGFLLGAGLKRAVAVVTRESEVVAGFER